MKTIFVLLVLCYASNNRHKEFRACYAVMLSGPPLDSENGLEWRALVKD